MRTIRTNKKREIILKALADMPVIGRACEKAAIGRRSYYEWIEDDKEFKAETEAAIERGVDRLEEAGYERATRKKNPSDTLLIFLLKGHRKKYSDRVELSDPDGKNPLIPLANALKKAFTDE